MSIIRKINGVDVNPSSQIKINNLTTEDITDTTDETALSSVRITAGTFVTGDVVGIETRLRTSGSNGDKTVRIRIGTGQTVSEELAATTVSDHNSHAFLPISRMMTIKAEDGTGSGTELISATQGFSSDIGASYDSFTDYANLSVDWTVDNYIVVTGQLGNSLDVMNCMHIHVIFPGT